MLGRIRSFRGLFNENTSKQRQLTAMGEPTRLDDMHASWPSWCFRKELAISCLYAARESGLARRKDLKAED